LGFHLPPKGLRSHPATTDADFDSGRTAKDSSAEGYAFFLVAQNSIREVVSLHNFLDSGFDPTLLVPASADSELDWVDEERWSAATDIFWYRKFYAETRVGQLMLLRSDKPKIFDAEDVRRGYPFLSDFESDSVTPAPEAGQWLGTPFRATQDKFGQIHKIVLGIRSVLWILMAIMILDLLLRWRKVFAFASNCLQSKLHHESRHSPAVPSRRLVRVRRGPGSKAASLGCGESRIAERARLVGGCKRRLSLALEDRASEGQANALPGYG